jgi:cell wall-associated NlpC family hydrolase
MDERTLLARNGIAAAGLEGLVAARAYRETTPMRLILPSSPMRDLPDFMAQATSELLFGETFEVLFEEEGFAFGQNRRDGYVGYVAQSELTEIDGPPTHRVSAQTALVFDAPDIKTPDPLGLSRNSLVRVIGHEGRFARLSGEDYIVDAQLAPLGVYERDMAAVAQGYLGAPYLWGGRSAAGLDCSGLVQQALTACGRWCPRDSDMQRNAFAPAPQDSLARGDLVFWPGHVAILLDGATMIHANAFHMQTAIEPLAEAIARIGAPAAYRRPGL